MAKVKFVLLVPLTYNDGSQILRETLDQIEDKLFAFADGYTIAGVTKGAYRMQSGAKQVDEASQMWVVVDEKDEAALRSIVAEIGQLLGQESMYLERTTSTVEFVPSLPRKGPI